MDTLIAFNYRNVWPNCIEDKGPYLTDEKLMTENSDNLRFVSTSVSHKMMGYAIWDKVYRKEIIDNYKLRDLGRDEVGNIDDWAEDLFFNLQYMMCVKKMITIEIAPYCLRKHGMPEQQNESGLVGRINHMMNLFEALKESYSYQMTEMFQNEFWKIVIWHLRRYIYLDASAYSIKGLRKECTNSIHWKELKKYIKQAQRNWANYCDRWDKVQARDYRYMLDYIIDGNIIKFKIKNKILYRQKDSH